MHKKTIIYKQQARLLKRELNDFKDDLHHIDPNDWCDMWHYHLFERSYPLLTRKYLHNRIHTFLTMLDIIESTAPEGRLYQAFLILHEKQIWNDAVFMHTENPQSQFPWYNKNIKWDIEVPAWLPSIDWSTYRIGYTEFNDMHQYYIEKKGTNVPSNKPVAN